MLDHPDHDDLFGESSQALLRELEKNTSSNIQKMRAHERIAVRAKVVLRPGSLSQRDAWSLEGVTGDISRGGAKVLMPRPVFVGDVFQVAFDPEVLAVPPQLCLSQWCRTVRGDAFECGLSFFSPIDLAAALREPGT